MCLLQAKIARAQAAREHQQRKRNLTKYIPNAAAAIWTVLEAMADTAPRGPKRQRLMQQHDILEQVKKQEVGILVAASRIDIIAVGHSVKHSQPLEPRTAVPFMHGSCTCYTGS
jgi:DNA topoisomerase VI subunit B